MRNAFQDLADAYGIKPGLFEDAVTPPTTGGPSLESVPPGMASPATPDKLAAYDDVERQMRQSSQGWRRTDIVPPEPSGWVSIAENLPDITGGPGGWYNEYSRAMTGSMVSGVGHVGSYLERWVGSPGMRDWADAAIWMSKQPELQPAGGSGTKLWTARAIGDVVGGMAPMLATNALIPGSAIPYIYAQTKETMYQDMIGRGVDPKRAEWVSTATGIASAYVEWLQLKGVSKLIRNKASTVGLMSEAIQRRAFAEAAGTGGRFALSTGWNAISQGTREAAQSLIEQGGYAAGLQELPTVGDMLREASQRGVGAMVDYPAFGLLSPSKGMGAKPPAQKVEVRRTRPGVYLLDSPESAKSAGTQLAIDAQNRGIRALIDVGPNNEVSVRVEQRPLPMLPPVATVDPVARRKLVQDHIRLYRKLEGMNDTYQRGPVEREMYAAISQINAMDGHPDPLDGRPTIPPELVVLRELELRQLAGEQPSLAELAKRGVAVKQEKDGPKTITLTEPTAEEPIEVTMEKAMGGDPAATQIVNDAIKPALEQATPAQIEQGEYKGGVPTPPEKPSPVVQALQESAPQAQEATKPAKPVAQEPQQAEITQPETSQAPSLPPQPKTYIQFPGQKERYFKDEDGTWMEEKGKKGVPVANPGLAGALEAMLAEAEKPPAPEPLPDTKLKREASATKAAATRKAREADIEAQSGMPTAERKANLKITIDELKASDAYQFNAQAREDRFSGFSMPSKGKIYIGKQFAGELRDMAGERFGEGNNTAFRNLFTDDPTKGQPWDQIAAELSYRGRESGEMPAESMGINEFLDFVADWQRWRQGGIDIVAAQRAVAADPYVQALLRKADMLKKGFAAPEINEAMDELGRDYEMDVSGLKLKESGNEPAITKVPGREQPTGGGMAEEVQGPPGQAEGDKGLFGRTFFQATAGKQADLIADLGEIPMPDEAPPPDMPGQMKFGNPESGMTTLIPDLAEWMVREGKRVGRSILEGKDGVPVLFHQWKDTTSWLLRNMKGPSGAKIADGLEQINKGRNAEMQTNVLNAREAWKGLSKDQIETVCKMAGNRIPDSEHPDLVDRADIIRGIQRRVIPLAREQGVLREGMEVAGSENLYPQVLNDEGRAQIKRLVEKGASREVLGWAKEQVDKGRFDSEDDALAAMHDWASRTMRAPVSTLESVRTIELPDEWIDWNGPRVLQQEWQREYSLIEAAKQWGYDPDRPLRFPKLSAMLERLKMDNPEHGASTAAAVEGFVKAAFGIAPSSVEASKATRGIMAYEYMARLKSTAFIVQNGLERIVNSMAISPVNTLKVMGRYFPPVVGELTKSGAAWEERMMREGFLFPQGTSTEAFSRGATAKDLFTQLAHSTERGTQETISYVSWLKALSDIRFLKDQHPAAINELRKRLGFLVGLSDDQIKARLSRLASPEMLDEIKAGRYEPTKEDWAMFEYRMTRDYAHPIDIDNVGIYWYNSPLRRLAFLYKMTYPMRQAETVWRDVLKHGFKTGDWARAAGFVAGAIIAGELYQGYTDWMNNKDRGLFSQVPKTPENRRILRSIGYDLARGMGGFLLDMTYGVQEFVGGPAMGTLTNLTRLGADIAMNPDLTPEAFDKFASQEFRFVREAKAFGEKIGSWMGDENLTFALEYAKVRNDLREWIEWKEPTIPEQLKKSVVRAFEGRPDYGTGENSLALQYAANNILVGDLEDAADYVVHIATANAKDIGKQQGFPTDPNTWTKDQWAQAKAIEGVKADWQAITSSLTARAPMGGVSKYLEKRYYASLSKDQQKKVDELTTEYYKRAKAVVELAKGRMGQWNQPQP